MWLLKQWWVKLNYTYAYVYPALLLGLPKVEAAADVYPNFAEVSWQCLCSITDKNIDVFSIWPGFSTMTHPLHLLVGWQEYKEAL